MQLVTASQIGGSDLKIQENSLVGLLFEKGQQIEKLPYEELLPALLKRIEDL